MKMCEAFFSKHETFHKFPLLGLKKSGKNVTTHKVIPLRSPQGSFLQLEVWEQVPVD